MSILDNEGHDPNGLGNRPVYSLEIEGLVSLKHKLMAENEQLRAALKGAEIALARDEDIDGAMRCILSVAPEQQATKP